LRETKLNRQKLEEIDEVHGSSRPKVFADLRKTKGGNIQEFTLGTSMVKVDLHDFYHIEKAIEYEYKKQLLKIATEKQINHFRLYAETLNSIPRYCSNPYDLKGIRIGYGTNALTYKKSHMPNNMESVVKKLISMAKYKMKSGIEEEQGKKSLKQILKTDFKEFQYEIGYRDIVEIKLKNGIEVEFNQYFGGVEIKYDLRTRSKDHVLELLHQLEKLTPMPEDEEDPEVEE
jgi:hypothetical protein